MASIWVTGRADETETSVPRSAVRVLGLCVTEARPSVLVVSALRFVTGAVLAVPVAVAPEPARIAQGAAAWVLSIFAVYLFNGVTDVTEDRVNGSRRPIARGALGPVSAMYVVAAAAVLSLVATAGLPLAMTGAVAANLVLGYFYSGPPWHLKSRSVGTVAVLCLSGLLSYWGGYAVATGGDGLAAPTGLILFAVAATYWMTLVGVPAKDLSDIAGDAAAGRRTIGVTCGATVSRRVMLLAAFVLVAGFSTAVLVTGVPLTGCCVALAAGALGLLLASRDGSDDRRLQRRPYRVFMATQHLVHITALISNI